MLIDGSSFIFRAFYAVPELNTEDGVPTNATYGTINMLKQLQKKYTTPYWVCVFDSPEKTSRTEVYPLYKANRRSTPIELITQIPYIHNLITALGIPLIKQAGIEADDIIATIAKNMSAQGHQIIIVTGDKDFTQIVAPDISLLNTMTNKILNELEVKNKFGVHPYQMIDYLSLVGDTSDNIPGIHQCGPKTAQKWLEQYQSIEQLIINQDQLKGNVGKNFRENIAWLKTAQQLISLDCQIKIPNINLNDSNNFILHQPDYQSLQHQYQNLNFRTWFNEIKQINQQNANNNSQITKKINNLKLNDLTQLKSVINKIIVNNSTTAVIIFQQEGIIDSLIISTDQQNFIYKSSSELFSELEKPTQLQQELRIILINYLSSQASKITINLKEIYHLLQVDNEFTAIDDLVLLDYVANSQTIHSLSAIINRNLNQEFISLEYLMAKGTRKKYFTQLLEPEQELIIEMVAKIATSFLNLKNKLNTEELKLYQTMELNLVYILYQMERYGIKIDKKEFAQLSIQLNLRLKDLEQQIYQTSKMVFNINSPEQLQRVLFIEMGLPSAGIKKNTYGYSTDEASLSHLLDQGINFAKILLEYRYLSKLTNTYIDKLPQLSDHNDYIHTTFEQSLVSSGRLSSKNPNLQNIPIRNEYGKHIRQCFIAPSGYQIIKADYSQIELRILAHIAHDELLIAAFQQQQDIHSITASEIFNQPIAQINQEQRRYAKSINFGLIYGKTVFGLAKELKITKEAAKTYIERYFNRFPQVRIYMERIIKLAHEQKFVNTLYGRKIELKNINSKNNMLVQADERLALNAPMQGTSADIIKLAMINIAGWLKKNRLQTKLILQVHDELILEVPDQEVQLVKDNLAFLMQEKTQLSVPLVVEVKVGRNWAS